MTDYAKLYQPIHDAGKYFNGYSVCEYADQIGEQISSHNAVRLLDYGSGKGAQYLVRRIHENWDVPVPVCYDPGVRYLAEKPVGHFDGVICADVMEHIEAKDIPAVLAEIDSYASGAGFVFFVISCRPTKKRLSDGRDVHLTIEPPEWWIDTIKGNLRRAMVGPKAKRLHVIAHFEAGPEARSVWDSRA